MDKEKEEILLGNLCQKLKELEFFRESRESEIRFMNWLLIVAAGILLMTISNIDKFLINNKLFLKPLFFIYVLLLGISILAIGIMRFSHFLSDYGMSTMYSSIRKIQWDIENNQGDKDENLKKIEERIDGWIKAYNLVHTFFCFGFLKKGFIILLTSILLFVIYFILLVIFKY